MRRTMAMTAALAVLSCGTTTGSWGAGSSAGEEVWHLRVGLNVAALLCRGPGRSDVAPDYARLLSRHRQLFTDAYAAEQRRYGSRFDSHQTRIYNRFSNQRDPYRFCRTAMTVARRALALDSAQLAVRAPSLLSEID